MVIESPPRGEGPVPSLTSEVAFQQLLDLLLGPRLAYVDRSVLEERGVEFEDRRGWGLGLNGPGIEVDTAENGPEADGGGEEDEEENAEERTDRPGLRFHWWVGSLHGFG